MRGATIAQWMCLRLTYCRPRFNSQALSTLLSFIVKFVLYFSIRCEKKMKKTRRGRVCPFKKEWNGWNILYLVRGPNGRLRACARVEIVWGKVCANRISGAGELQLRLNGHEMNVVRVGLASEAVEVDERVWGVAFILDKFEPAWNKWRNWSFFAFELNPFYFLLLNLVCFGWSCYWPICRLLNS